MNGESETGNVPEDPQVKNSYAALGAEHEADVAEAAGEITKTEQDTGEPTEDELAYVRGEIARRSGPDRVVTAEQARHIALAHRAGKWL